jgi:hypothetical protein
MPRATALATALAAAGAATAIAVLPAQGQDPPATRTLTFASTQAQRDFTAIDTKPKGESIGDRFEFASLLRQSGHVAGRVEADCVGVDATYKMLDCSLVVLLAGGRLTLQGGYLAKSVPGVGGTREEYAITGGTGVYTGATGTMRRSGNGRRDTLTFTLSG